MADIRSRLSGGAFTGSSGAHAAVTESLSHADAAGGLDASLRWIRFAAPSLSSSAISTAHISAASSSPVAPAPSPLHAFWCGVLQMQSAPVAPPPPMIRAASMARTGVTAAAPSSVADALPSGSVVSSFRFPGDDVGVLFEHSRTRPPAATPVRVNAHGYPLSPTTSVSLLVYVDSAVGVARRAEAAGFVVYVPPLSVCDEPAAQSAVLLDPSGMRVRLMEGEAYGLQTKRQRGRIGHITLMMKEHAQMEATLNFYARVFKAASLRSSAALLLAGAAAGAAPLGGSLASPAAVDPAVSSALSVAPRGAQNYFRLVDMERFVEDRASFAWLANGPRKKHAAVCLHHKANSAAAVTGKREQQPAVLGKGPASTPTETADDDAAAASILTRITASPAGDAEQRVFLGLSFSVSDLEQSLRFLRSIESWPLLQAALGGSTAPAESSQASAAPSCANAAPVSTTRLHMQQLSGQSRFIALMDPAGHPLHISDGAISGLKGVSGSVPRDEANSISMHSNRSSRAPVPPASPSPGTARVRTVASLSMRTESAASSNDDDALASPLQGEWSDDDVSLSPRSGRAGRQRRVGVAMRRSHAADDGADSPSPDSDEHE